ncbi:hypothetical protein SNEBB_007480 [Seison nebaliae]|nr:hypothetical protein SNEBB_007480 [Seison nebaliae]
MDKFVSISPKNEITFVGPFSQLSTSNVTITNEIDQIVAFKVKTTAPRKYCVRPNCGIIEPNKSVDVELMLQPEQYNPKNTEENIRHKFMIQSAIGDATCADNLEAFWRSISPAEIKDHRLKVNFRSESLTERRVPSAQGLGISVSHDTDMKGNTTKMETALPESDVQKELNLFKEKYEACLKEIESLKSSYRNVRTSSNPELAQPRGVPFVVLLFIGLVAFILGIFVGTFLLPGKMDAVEV